VSASSSGRIQKLRSKHEDRIITEFCTSHLFVRNHCCRLKMYEKNVHGDMSHRKSLMTRKNVLRKKIILRRRRSKAQWQPGRIIATRLPIDGFYAKKKFLRCSSTREIETTHENAHAKLYRCRMDTAVGSDTSGFILWP